MYWPEGAYQYILRSVSFIKKKYFLLVSEEDSNPDPLKIEYFAKISAQKQCHSQLTAHKILDPLNCPHIIKLHEAWPEINELHDGFIITRKYNQFDFEVLKHHAKIVIWQLLQVSLSSPDIVS